MGSHGNSQEELRTAVNQALISSTMRRMDAAGARPRATWASVFQTVSAFIGGIAVLAGIPYAFGPNGFQFRGASISFAVAVVSVLVYALARRRTKNPRA